MLIRSPQPCEAVLMASAWRSAVAILLLAVAGCGGDPLPSGPGPKEAPFQPGVDQRARVKSVISGEMLELETGQRVRLLGVDAPEGDESCTLESTQYLERLTEGRRVELDYCPAPPDGEPLDGDAASAYVVVPGQSFVNLELLRAGLGQFRGSVGECGGRAAEARLERGQAEAVSAGRGMFGAGACGAPPPPPEPVGSPSPGPSATPTPTPRPAPTPTPTPEPTPEPEPTPVVMVSPAPGTDAARASIRIFGLGNPPPEPPLRGEKSVEAVVLNAKPSYVEFYVDNRHVRTDRRWPYTLGDDRFDTRTVSDGMHVATARAVFPDGSVLVTHQPMWVDNN
jgi:endonuclease YncB( thermonuclease family)